MSERTPLYDAHLRAGAKMVPFAGYEMPIHYGSQIHEHTAVRESCGLFDVSHMAVTDLSGDGARSFLRGLLANDVARLDGEDGRALYSCLLNDQGGVIDDLIAYRRSAETWRIVSNAATRATVRPLLDQTARQANVRCEPRDDLAMIAVQGPKAVTVLTQALGPDSKPAAELGAFRALETSQAFIGRTGYTGEDGFEVIIPAGDAETVWDALVDAGGAPCGLGARDSLRLEAGLPLNGQDLDTETTPLEAGLAWTVAWEPAERTFPGRDALEAQRRDGVPRKTVGLLPEGRAPARAGYIVRTDAGDGVVTSGGYGPTLGAPLAVARVPADAESDFRIVIRNREVPARAVKLPFVRHGTVRV